LVKGERMAKAPVTKEEVKDQAEKGKGLCPWCNYKNDEESVGEVHDKRANAVVLTENMLNQCLTCGKTWSKEALGKPWTLALERGPAWEREVRARELRGA